MKSAMDLSALTSHCTERPRRNGIKIKDKNQVMQVSFREGLTDEQHRDIAETRLSPSILEFAIIFNPSFILPSTFHPCSQEAARVAFEARKTKAEVETLVVSWTQRSEQLFLIYSQSDPNCYFILVPKIPQGLFSLSQETLQQEAIAKGSTAPSETIGAAEISTDQTGDDGEQGEEEKMLSRDALVQVDGGENVD